MHLRSLRSDDRPDLAEVLRSNHTEFNAADLACALELIDLVLGDPAQRDYRVLIAAGGVGSGSPGTADLDRPIGYALYGPTPLTEATWDLYWIAIRADCRGQGIGRALLDRVEEEIAAGGGRLLRIETSTKEAYGATRGFYEKRQYQPAGFIPDFYCAGDGLVTFVKSLPVVRAVAPRPRP